MNDNEVAPSGKPPRLPPWNKGKLIGAKPPLWPSHVWSIRTKLQIEKRSRDLALFNLAIDSKLRGCDVVAVRIDDIAPNGYTLDRATVRQKKTGRPVQFELTEQTRQAIDEYLRQTGRPRVQFLFAGRGDATGGLTTRQYARLVGDWIASIGLDPLAQPGGNITGATRLSSELGPKRLQLMHEIVPAATSMTLLVNPKNPSITEPERRQVEAAAVTLGHSSCMFSRRATSAASTQPSQPRSNGVPLRSSSRRMHSSAISAPSSAHCRSGTGCPRSTATGSSSAPAA